MEKSQIQNLIKLYNIRDNGDNKDEKIVSTEMVGVFIQMIDRIDEMQVQIDTLEEKLYFALNGKYTFHGEVK